MKTKIGHVVVGLIILAAVSIMVSSWVRAASGRIVKNQAEQSDRKVAVAANADEGYCSPSLKQILRRVLTSCGLVKDGQRGRGCQPLEAKNVAAMSGADFNALFRPLAHRAAIIQFDQKESILDDPARLLLEKTFSDQRGASYFLVVTRSSPEGTVERNRELSEARAASVLAHLQTKFSDPDLDKEVGLLWLGEEFAQLEEEFCKWNRSRADAPCVSADLNRSAFVAWIDCRL